MQTDPARSLSDTAYDRLVEWLDGDGFPDGTRLPGENALARRLSVSRPVLRQALARLRAEGRLEARKGSGTYVRRVEPPALPPIVFGPLGNIPDVRAFLEFRCGLESAMAAEAARRADPAGLARLSAALAALQAETEAGGGGGSIEADIAFHQAVAEASGNRFFLAVMQALVEQTRFGIRLTRELSDMPEAERFATLRREHGRVAAAILAGDAMAAQAAMQAHLRNGIQRLFGG
ncbi:FadR/GntR family transcriptional regulator [Pseudoroseomonas cervicalis]|uniref:FadR/GntR family transcriptional regulator n=1 Tax=Teichococcus cervicalis TaxID=204525 RepID=UPI0022F1C15D|nr:FCD domain-containing protein [Pseudoroseomonas cervicalis]WBV45198.1 FCD domain-containing protein [Pseudoroseomonas cervicalis]